LALQLLENATNRGKEAYLIADDRLEMSVEGGKLIMHAPPAIAGLIELRGRGIVTRPHADSAEVHLVVDMSPEYERLVEEEELTVELEGVTCARCPLPNRDKIDALHQQLLISEALNALNGA
jgi:serine kinase of HPr protein (carbohydrate metabolism regulator)